MTPALAFLGVGGPVILACTFIKAWDVFKSFIR